MNFFEQLKILIRKPQNSREIWGIKRETPTSPPPLPLNASSEAKRKAPLTITIYNSRAFNIFRFDPLYNFCILSWGFSSLFPSLKCFICSSIHLLYFGSFRKKLKWKIISRISSSCIKLQPASFRCLQTKIN